MQESWRDVKYGGGEIIDARDGKVRRQRVPSLDRGTLILLTDKSEAIYRPDQTSAAVEAVKAVLEHLEN